MILVIDNYDSFTYNLVQYLAELGAEVEVHRNDALTAAAIVARKPEAILISPGPGTPDDAGVTLDLLRDHAGALPILGVCLGHQAIGQAFGAKVVRAERLMHGRTAPICHEGAGVFTGLPSPFIATRYHSLIVDRETVTPQTELEITAWSPQGEIMGLRHRSLPIEGVQFHPESFLTEHGHALLLNFLKQLPERGRAPAEVV
jgi:anthranilate synthase/aminodeoxychorismate synthase-like glutamine amidotransferase